MPYLCRETIEEKKTFIRENQLCFGCLWKRCVIKDAKGDTRVVHTASITRPACIKTLMAALEQNPTPTEDSSDQEVHNALSYAMTQSSSSPSSTVPVFLSGPNRELLTYALLDTQSDSNFILRDLLKELNVNAPSVRL